MYIGSRRTLLTRSQGGGGPPPPSALETFLSGLAGTDYAVFDAKRWSTKMWQDSAGTTPVTANGNAIGKWNDEGVGGNNAAQAISNSRPSLQGSPSTPVARLDGSDDYFTTGINFHATLNTILFKVAVGPGAAGDYICGFNGSSNRFLLGINASGFLFCGYGSTLAFITGAVDIRGQTGVAGLVSDAVNIALYWNKALVGSAPLGAGGPINTTAAIPLGVRTDATPAFAGHFAGDIDFAMLAKKAATLSEVGGLTDYINART